MLSPLLTSEPLSLQRDPGGLFAVLLRKNTLLRENTLETEHPSEQRVLSYNTLGMLS